MKSKSAERPDYEQYTDEELILRLRDGDMPSRILLWINIKIL